MYALRNSISGRTLTLKNYPKLALCSPYITFGSDWLMIYAPNMMTVLGIHTINNQVINIPIDQLSLTSNISDDSRDLLVSVLYESILSYIMIHHPTLPDHLEITSESINLCFDCTNAIQISTIADQWFSQFLQIPCSLVKQDLLHTTTNSTHEKSFTNNGQFLMISKQSLENLQDKVRI